MKTYLFDTAYMSAANRYAVTVANTYNPEWHWALIYDYLKDDPNDLAAPASPYTDFRYLTGFLMSNLGRYSAFLFSDPSDNWVGPYTWQNPPPPGLVGLPYALNYTIIDPAGHAQKVTTPGLAGTTIPTFNDSGGTTASGGVIFSDQGLYPGASAQALQLVTDGTNYYSPLQRNFGGQFLEDVTDLNTSVNPLRIWANNVLQTGGGTNYTLSTGPGLAIPTASYEGLYVTWVGTPATPITAAFNFYFRAALESDEQDIEQFQNTVWTIGGEKSKNGSGMLKLMTRRPPP